ncbi:hypothetical protein ACFL0V_00130 [Nanoarchaeota archaeon]
MAKKSKFGSMKTYGPRYGRRNKEKAAALEQEYRFKHPCPYCNYEKLKREAPGIWKCAKCGVKFAGKAYATPKKLKVKEMKTEDLMAEIQEKEEELEDLEDESEDELEDTEELAEEASEDEAESEETSAEPVEDVEESAEPVEEVAEEPVEEEIPAEETEESKEGA